MTLLLFDIDGTLIAGGGAGRRALTRAFAQVTGVQQALDGVQLGGRTDMAIMREACRQQGLEWNASLAAQVQEVYEQMLPVEVERHPGHMCPGVREVLDVCSSREDFRLALGTGNIESCARAKLAPHDLNRYFPTGGFGDHTENRDEMIAAGLQRARGHYGSDFRSVVVIGDTPKDISSARANGCGVVAVATGTADFVELQSHRPDALLADLSDLWAAITALEQAATEARAVG